MLGAALASVMRVPAERSAQVALHLASLRRVHQARTAGAIDEARAFLLVNLIATYLPLSVHERDELRVQLQQEGDATMEATELTWADRIYLEGRVQGIRETLGLYIRARFGRLSPELEARLDAMTREEELAAFTEHVGKAQSEAELLAF